MFKVKKTAVLALVALGLSIHPVHSMENTFIGSWVSRTQVIEITHYGLHWETAEDSTSECSFGNLVKKAKKYLWHGTCTLGNNSPTEAWITINPIGKYHISALYINVTGKYAEDGLIDDVFF